MSRSESPTSPASPSVPEGGRRPSRARLWWAASRPATLAASVSPVLAGVAVAVHDHHVRTLPGLGALLVAVAMQLGVNYANDYSDFVRGADRRRVGPPRAASSGLVTPARVRDAAIAAFGLAAGAGLALSLATDWRLLGLGALAVLAGWLYTGGPRPYGYAGLGEPVVFLFFGLVATVGTVYVQELRIPPAAWLAGCCTGLLACAILGINNLRDIDTDREAGKRTLAVRVGAPATRRLVGAYFAIALAAPFLGTALGWVPRLAALPLLTFTMIVPLLRSLTSTEPAVLVGALKRSSQVEVWWALLWTVGLVA